MIFQKNEKLEESQKKKPVKKGIPCGMPFLSYYF